jgi:hypothetical protein
MIPTLNRRGSMFLDGSTYEAPRFVSSEPTVSKRGLEVSAPTDSEEWKEFLAKVDHACKSGPCQCALRPRCKGITIPQLCGCGGSGHRKAMLRKYHDITEYLEEPGDSSPSSFEVETLWV